MHPVPVRGKPFLSLPLTPLSPSTDMQVNVQAHKGLIGTVTYVNSVMYPAIVSFD
jgi:hypothetical protein